MYVICINIMRSLNLRRHNLGARSQATSSDLSMSDVEVIGQMSWKRHQWRSLLNLMDIQVSSIRKLEFHRRSLSRRKKMLKSVEFLNRRRIVVEPGNIDASTSKILTSTYLVSFSKFLQICLFVAWRSRDRAKMSTKFFFHVRGINPAKCTPLFQMQLKLCFFCSNSPKSLEQNSIKKSRLFSTAFHQEWSKGCPNIVDYLIVFHFQD